MITVQAISFSCSTIEEAVALAKKLGLGQQQMPPQALPSQPAALPAPTAGASISDAAQDNPAWPVPTTSSKSKTSKFATDVKAKTVRTKSPRLANGIDIDAASPTKKTRVPNGAYDFLGEIAVGRSKTVALGASANLSSAFGRYRKHHEKDAKFTWEKLQSGKFKVTRVE